MGRIVQYKAVKKSQTFCDIGEPIWVQCGAEKVLDMISAKTSTRF